MKICFWFSNAGEGSLIGKPIVSAPLERLELSLSAPEADALSTELQGRMKKFYHKAQTTKDCRVSGSDLRRQGGQLIAQVLDGAAVAILLAQLLELLLLVS